MKFHFMHPDIRQLRALGIAESDHIMLIASELSQISMEYLENNKFAVVAPGNSFGIMDGGYDEAIIRYFGPKVQECIQRWIAKDYFGELPVGCAISIMARENPNYLFPAIVYAPTMQIPMRIIGTANVYYATLAAIRGARQMGCENVLLPLMGAGTGCVPLLDVGAQMMAAIDASRSGITAKDLNWDYAARRHSLWHKLTGAPE